MRRKRGSLLAFLIPLWIGPVFCAGDPIVADHTAVQQFEQIPEFWLEEAKKLAVHYGTTSHGTQVLSGMLNIESFIDSNYSVAVDTTYTRGDARLPAPENPPEIRILKQGAHPEDYWDGADGIASTRAFVESGLYDISMWMWCGEHGGYASYVQQYLDTINMFEHDYPHIQFIYATGHAGFYSIPGNNAMIREYAINNGKVLFDAEDIEKHDPDGNYYPNEDSTGTWCDDWCATHPQDCQDLLDRGETGHTTCCPHAHGLICRMKGKAFWWLMARLAGWQGLPETHAGSSTQNSSHPDEP